MSDLHCSHGPVRSMPGSSHSFPPGSMCDRHANRPAVKRVQGETDSFGAEYILMCDKCVRGMEHYQRNMAEKECFCAWCKTMQKGVRPYRDMDEGMAGPVYDVCPGCRAKDQQRWADEYEAQHGDGGHDDWYDDHGDDDDDFFEPD